MGNSAVSHPFVHTRWFALLVLCLVLVSGAIWILKPEMGLWSLLVALLPWTIRFLRAEKPYTIQNNFINWFMAIFLITAWIGYWAAYDKAGAWQKGWLIVTAVLLFYSLCFQPIENFGYVSMIFLGIGVGISIYFFLSHEFAIDSGRLAHWWMNNRPLLGWIDLPHGYISGLLALTSSFSLYTFWEKRKLFPDRLPVLFSLFFLLGGSLVVGAFLLSASRGIWLAIGIAVTVGLLWKLLASDKLQPIPGLKRKFPLFVVCYLGVMIFLVNLISSTSSDISTGEYGKNTRSELVLRGADLLADFPLSGGGLNSFSGLYSRYILVIPVFYFANSHNVFMDVAIEQGVLGGMVFCLVYLGSIWMVASTIVNTGSSEIRAFSWLSLYVLVIGIIHGLLYDYIYIGSGTLLLFFPAGASMMAVENSAKETGLRDFDEFKVANKSIIRKVVTSLISVIVLLLSLNFDDFRSTWYSNLGAVQLAKVELTGFPTNQWTVPSALPELDQAQATLQTSLQFDPSNWSANYRLGLISMSRNDFDSAVEYLEKAHQSRPTHRGIIKSLGYSNVWLGEYENAWKLLEQIPESHNELSLYEWWWGMYGYSDLSERSTQMLSMFETDMPPP